MRLLPVSLNGETYMVRQHDDGTFEMPAELAALDGRNVALKPGQEIWWLARKPLAGRTVAATVLEHGTGALNIAACRVGADLRTNNAGGSSSLQRVSRVESGYRTTVTASEGEASEVAGRWPANVVFTHSAACEPLGTRKVKGITGGTGHHGNAVYGKLSYDEGVPVKDYADADGLEEVEAWSCAPDCPVGELDRQSGVRPGFASQRDLTGSSGTGSVYGENMKVIRPGTTREGRNDTGGASRFFPVFRYQAKAPAKERPRIEGAPAHPTVKPLELMRWLVRLVTPPGGVVLDPFAGTGTTGQAAQLEGMRSVLVEQDGGYADLVRVRIPDVITVPAWRAPA
jgi:hypothetical protein